MVVVFADDDIDDREFFIDALSYVDPAIKCILARDCEDALAILSATPEIPEYIFLDIHMPEMDGKGCLQAIRQNEKYNPMRVVMYSNSSDQKMMEEYKMLGATYFMVKPPTFKDLCDSLSILFDK
jgi:DNA-binding NtrC family response regulator